MIATPHDLVVTHWGARFMGRRFPCAVGRGGVAKNKVEGDGVTPAGRFRVVEMIHRPDREVRAGLPGPALTNRLGLVWSDDPRDPFYNSGRVDVRYPFGHERMRRPDPLYDLVGVMDYNYPVARPGAGSAIFLHVWRRPRYPTEGCIALSRADLRWILARWTVRSRIVIS